MNEWKKFIEYYKKSYNFLYEDINNFAITYKFVSSISASEVRKLLLRVLDQIDVMADAGKNISNFIEKIENDKLWEISLEEFNYISWENN